MKVKRTSDGYMLRLEKGEEVVSTITGFVASENIQAGTIAGLGAVCDATIGYFSSHSKKYYQQSFEGEFELLSLTGNISWLDDKPVLHAHVVLSKPDYSLIGGHLFSAVVALTVEAHIRPFEPKIFRKLDKDIGLNLMDI